MYNQNVKLSTAIVNISPTDSLQAQEAVCSLAEQGVAGIIGPNNIESSGKYSHNRIRNNSFDCCICCTQESFRPFAKRWAFRISLPIGSRLKTL